jgi:hypothetical protein
MSVVSKLIGILNRREMGGSGNESNSGGGPKPKPKPKKVKDTGLVLYESDEKTPTGKSNSFSSNNKTDEDLIAYAKKYNFPTTSNAAFQQAQYDYLNSTPEGKEVLKQMVSKYGMPKSGSYADNYLGARASEMMNNIELLNQQPKQTQEPAVPLKGDGTPFRIDDFTHRGDDEWVGVSNPMVYGDTGSDYSIGFKNAYTGKIVPHARTLEDAIKLGMKYEAFRKYQEDFKKNPEKYDTDEDVYTDYGYGLIKYKKTPKFVTPEWKKSYNEQMRARGYKGYGSN